MGWLPPSADDVGLMLTAAEGPDVGADAGVGLAGGETAGVAACLPLGPAAAAAAAAAAVVGSREDCRTAEGA